MATYASAGDVTAQAGKGLWPIRTSTAVLVLVLAVMSTQFAHADLAYIAWKSHFVSLGHLNVYEAVNGAAPERLQDVTYPPLAYWLFGAWLAIGHALFGVLDRGFSLGAGWTSPVHLRHFDAAWFRLLYFPFVLWLAPLTVRMLRALGIAVGKAQREVAFFALAQPVVLLVTFMIGQFDAIPAVLTFAGVLMLAEGSALGGVSLLAFGGLVKLYPFGVMAVAVPLAWLLNQDPRFRRKLLAGVLGVAVACAALIAALWGDAVRGSLLRFSQTGGPADARSMGLSVWVFAIVLVAIAAISIPWWPKSEAAAPNRTGSLLLRAREPVVAARIMFFGATSCIAVLFVARQWHVQYVAWTAPFFATAALFFAARARSAWIWTGHVAFTLAVVLATLVGRPRNYYLKGPFFLDGWPVALRPPAWLPWSIVSAYCIVQIFLGARECISAMRVSPTPMDFDTGLASKLWRLGVWLSIGFVSYAALHLIVGAV